MRITSPDERSRIVAVAASCFWHALMGVDSNGDAVTPLYSWADTRAHVAVPILQKRFETRSYHQTTGAFIHPCYWPSKIEWLRQTNPTLAGKIARWISFPDYIAFKLSGTFKTSISIASGTGLMNRASSEWDDTILKSLALTRDQLPEIADDTATFTPTKRISGLPSIPWHYAFGDGSCSNIGAGGTSDHRLVINVSTSGAVRFITNQASSALPDGLFGYRLDKARHVIGGAISNGGNVYAWLMNSLKITPEPSLDRMLSTAKPANHGLCVMPFWAGERSPGWHANAQGSILGMDLSTTPLEITQATLESVAYSIRQVRDMIALKYPQASDVIISGGAVDSSRYMQQLLSDAMNSTVRVSLDAEPSGRGAALAVAERLGAISSIETAKDELSRPIKPRPAAALAHDLAFKKYVNWYEKLIDL
jgi:gluconokinase